MDKSKPVYIGDMQPSGDTPEDVIEFGARIVQANYPAAFVKFGICSCGRLCYFADTDRESKEVQCDKCKAQVTCNTKLEPHQIFTVCALCGNPNVDASSFCYGCGELVCESCADLGALIFPQGRHRIDAHVNALEEAGEQVQAWKSERVN